MGNTRQRRSAKRGIEQSPPPPHFPINNLLAAFWSTKTNHHLWGKEQLKPLSTPHFPAKPPSHLPLDYFSPICPLSTHSPRPFILSGSAMFVHFLPIIFFPAKCVDSQMSHHTLLLFQLILLLLCPSAFPQIRHQFLPSTFPSESSAPAFRTESPELAQFSLDDFAHSLRIEKDQSDPSRLLNVFLPSSQQRHFRQFIARVSDISSVDETRFRDANRTFLASLADSSVINVHGLNPGHKYQVAILGRKEAESLLIREDQILMDPIPLDFGVPGNSTAIQTTSHNITMRAQKAERALQDTFRVEYHQLDPLKRFPILDVHDIQEQREVELYLGNLAPGRDYAISVSSLRDELPSQSWRGIVTTRPLRPIELSIVEINSSCVLFQWHLPPESGADRFKIAYGMLHGPQSMQKIETQYPHQQVQICQNILPGRVFIFAVIAEKSRQISDASTLSHTIRPLPPRELTVEPDFEKAQFRIRVQLAPEEESFTEKCQISVQPEEQGGKSEQASVTANANQCEAQFDLVPGRRYEISAIAISGQSASTRVLRNRAIEPGFNFGAFGLTLREGEGEGTLRLEWPQSEVARLRIADLWARIVGRDSHLHFSVQQLDGANANANQHQNRETGPTEPGPVIVEGIWEGECYKVSLYTVTSSGIVSEHRFEQFIRTNAPKLDLAIGQLSAHSATLQAFLFRPKHSNGPISGQCQLQVIVSDSITSELLLDRSIPLSEQRSPSLSLDGLKPWRKYSANGQVTCGSLNQSPCAPKVHRIGRVEFRTEPAPPGPIMNFTIRPINSYSAQLRWWPPEEANGRISHYIVQVEPRQGEEWGTVDELMRPWTERVDGQRTDGGGGRGELGADGSESILPREPIMVEKVLDGLAGGRHYGMEVWAVNEAGQGRGSGQLGVEMPIAAPPRPGRAIQILVDTVRSQELSIRLDFGQLSERNGRLIKMALVVAEIEENDGTEGKLREEEEGENGTLPNWAMARRIAGKWPPFVAMEMETTLRLGKSSMVQKIGAEIDCEQRPPETICNGQLKPGAIYKFKLRLFTAPHLWTDSPYSDSIHLELPVGESALGQSFLLIILVIFLIGIASAIFVKRHRRRKEKSNFCHDDPVPPYIRQSPDSQQRSREGQWNALKMIMAERAADCLAKLGLDPGPVANSPEKAPNPPPVRPSSGGGNVLCGGAASISANNQLFSAPHHRRSKSLRERTGVDQRLERLPSGPHHRHSTLPWTVLRGDQPPERSRPVQICNFIEHVRLMSADSDFRFSEEYEELRIVGLGQSCTFADSPANRAKNRFTNILPYDHSRVKLKCIDDEDGSDYVNASYIPGFNSRREFIAAQGPLPSTRDHFWRLVWEQNVPAIVALTKCVEKGRDKCHQYWPDNSQRSVLYADIEVTLLTESIEYEEFTIRELRLTNLSEPSQPPRAVQHLHYQAWPDFGVPEHPAGIVHFARLFRNKLPPSSLNKPTIVHCSAGVGRSGTFIALDRLVQNIECGKPIDVFGTVHEMRMERCHMVQNEQQYIFIHQSLQFVLENFFPFLLSPSSHQQPPSGEQNNSSSRSPASISRHMPFGSSISSPIGGIHNSTKESAGCPNSQQFMMLNGSWNLGGPCQPSPQNGPLPWPNMAPKIEVQHQNEGFLEDDEGIAESGL